MCSEVCDAAAAAKTHSHKYFLRVTKGKKAIYLYQNSQLSLLDNGAGPHIIVRCYNTSQMPHHLPKLHNQQQWMSPMPTTGLL